MKTLIKNLKMLAMITVICMVAVSVHAKPLVKLADKPETTSTVNLISALNFQVQLPRDEVEQIQMTRVLQRVIEARRIQIEAIPYSQAWGEFDSAADLTALQDPSS